MTEADPPGRHQAAGGGEVALFPSPRRTEAGQASLDKQPSLDRQVSFDRHELRQILSLYGRMVALGEWRDYAIDFLRDRAVFSIFRRTSEVPLYRIVKDPALARRQGAYSVIAASGMILKRGHELERVLRAIDKPVTLVPH
jgi:hypothetical protein